MEDAQKKIKVVIAGRSFPVKVTAEEEPSVRNIEREVNAKIHEFQQKYADKDKIDHIIMVLLTQSFELERAKSSQLNVDKINTQLDTLESSLDSALKAKL